jgi:hypothetical protein
MSTTSPEYEAAEPVRTSPFHTARPAVSWRTLLLALGLLLIFSLLLGYVQYGTPALVGADGYYHARMGWLIREQGIKPDFIWLPQTVLNPDAYYDHHLLYHVYLALFARTDPAVDGGLALTQQVKVASVILPALAFLAIWWLLKGQGVRWPALWALALFAVSDAFLYRMSMPRTQSASLLVLALGLHWLLQRRYWTLIPLGFLYVWLYNAFPLLVIVGGVVMVAGWLREREVAWQAVAFPTLGIVLGLVINPYFPENLTFIGHHLLPKLGDSDVSVGNEWYPYRTWTVVQNSGVALAALVAGALAWAWREERINRASLAALGLAMTFGLMLFRARRFVEYFPAFALIFAALSVAPLLDGWLAVRPRAARLALAGLLIGFGLLAGLTMQQARKSVSGSRPADEYARAALWLREQAPPGSVVFQTDWDDFPRLFFYNIDATYTVGLDPVYMERYDSALYSQWVDITRGDVERPGRIIREIYGADYVFSDLRHGAFMREARQDPLLEEIYRDEYAIIYAVER